MRRLGGNKLKCNANVTQPSSIIVILSIAYFKNLFYFLLWSSFLLSHSLNIKISNLTFLLHLGKFTHDIVKNVFLYHIKISKL